MIAWLGKQAVSKIRRGEKRCKYFSSPETVSSTETLSTTSRHPSISEHVGSEVERRAPGECLFFDQPGKPRESLVLQLYGINKPCTYMYICTCTLYMYSYVHCTCTLMYMYMYVGLFLCLVQRPT